MKAKQLGEECQQLDQLLLNLMESKQPPNIVEALNNKMKKSVKFNCKNQPFRGNSSWQEFGPGVNLYFFLLKYLSILFILLFINAVPSLISNLKGKGLDIYHENAISHIKIDIMKASLANIPLPTLNKDQRALINQEIQSKEEIYSLAIRHKLVTVFNDIYLSLITLAFFIFWEIKSKQIINHDTRNIDLPSYRTLVMDNIFSQIQLSEHSIYESRASDNQKATERKLNSHQRTQNLSLEEIWQIRIKNHFQKFGKVDSVTIVYDHGEILQKLIDFNIIVKKFSQLQEKNQQQKKALYELLQMKFELIKIDYLDKTKNNIKKYDVPFLPKKAFVTFHTKQDRNRVKNLYKYKINKDQLKFSLHEHNLSMVDHKKLIPTIKKCNIEPVSITWQNFHRKRREQFKVTCFIGTFLCLVLCLALIAILLLSMKMAGLIDNRWHIQPLNNAPSTIQSVIDHPSYEEASNTANLQTLYNFCSSLQLSYSNFRLEYYNLCEQYFTNFTEQSLTMVVLSGLILLINLILNFIIYALVDYRRHRTTTQRNRFLIVNIFMVYLVNMVLLILLIRADFDDKNDTSTSLVHLIKVIFPQFETHKKIETYPDFNRKWYIHIGNQLLFNYVVSLIISPWFYVLLCWIFQKTKPVIVKLKAFSKHQTQLNEILLSESFDFQTFYAMTLTSFYFCMIFATGIPLFYLLGAISFMSMYFSSQLTFYSFCRVPQPFDHSINTFISKILLFGVAVHQILAIFFIEVQDIFPERQNMESQTGISVNSLGRKLAKGWMFIIMLMLVMIVYFFKKQIASLVKKKYFQNDQTKQLNEEQIMKQIDINVEKSNEYDNSISVDDQVNRSKNIEKTLHNKEISAENMSPFKSNYLQKYYYRMQDNKLYSNIYYTLTVFHKIVYNTQFRAPSVSKIEPETENIEKLEKL